MFRNKLYFTTKSYCICILNYMYNFSNDWFRVGMIGIWFCNYLMILLRNCKLWTVLVTQFMYSPGLSLCSFTKLGYINTYFTSVSDWNIWIMMLLLLWPLRCLILQFYIIVLFFFSLQPHLISSTVIHIVTYREEVLLESIFIRNISKVFVLVTPEKKITFKIIPSGLWHLSYQGENSFFIKICD